MAGLGEDLKETLAEVGLSYSVLRSGESAITGEYLSYDKDASPSQPFINLNALVVTLAYDSAASPGDIIKFKTDQRAWLVVSVFPELFEDEIIEKTGTLYKCNGLCKLERQSNTRDASYVETTVWTPIAIDLPCLISESVDSNGVDDEDYGRIQAQEHAFYMPAAYKPLPEDRITMSGEYVLGTAALGARQYRVKSVATDVYPGIAVIRLESDTRE